MNNSFYSGFHQLDKVENNSRTVKGAKIIIQDNEAMAVVFQPLKIWSEGYQGYLFVVPWFG